MITVMHLLIGIMVLGGAALVIMGLLLYRYCNEYDKIWEDLFS